MATKKITRREFIKFAGLASGATIVAACKPVEKIVETTKIIEKPEALSCPVHRSLSLMWEMYSLSVMQPPCRGEHCIRCHPEERSDDPEERSDEAISRLARGFFDRPRSRPSQ
jgi:hypothetical protein